MRAIIENLWPCPLRLKSCLICACIVLGVDPRPAAAASHEVTLGGGPGLFTVVEADHHLGWGGELHLHYGLGEMVSAAASAIVSSQEGLESDRRFYGVMAGLHTAIDVTAFVPYVDVLVGPMSAQSDLLSDPAWSLALGVGLDYRRDFDWAVGGGFRYYFDVLDPQGLPKVLLTDVHINAYFNLF